ncbi:MAG TPA: YetF domain-containing protein [Burkholderiales bacterium]|nr:YetF domain-containing protein [Burkholderiales bacterium]
MTLNWGELFGLSVPPLELMVRGSALYLFLLVVFRVVIKRRMGAIGMADILVLVIISDASQNAMAGEYKTVTDGFILIGTIIAWNYAFDWAAFQFPWLSRLLEPAPLLLIENGRILRRNLRVEFISDDELRSKLREHGVEDPALVAKAYIEPDGEVTVIKRK